MALEGKQRVIANHAATIVGDLDAFLASGFDLDLDPGGAGIQGVFQEFLDHGGRALDHLAGGDRIGDGFGEDVDARHGRGQGSVANGQFRRCRPGTQKQPRIGTDQNQSPQPCR